MPSEYIYDMLAFALTLMIGAAVVIFSQLIGNIWTMLLSLVMLSNGIVIGLIIMRSIKRKDGR